MERKTILIADDAEINREMLSIIFEEQFEILKACDGQETIDIIKENGKDISLLFLDLIMPKKTGIEVLEYMNENGYIQTIPVIMITGESTNETDEKAYEYGASDIIYKPFAPNVVMRRAKNIMELFEHRVYLEQELENRTEELLASKRELEESNDFLVNALSSVVEFRSLESGEHIQRVKYFTGIFLKYVMQEYPEYGITDEQAALIIAASALHDLGKIAIPDSILLKPGKLTKDEMDVMKTHTTQGCELLENFKRADNEFYRYCYDICRWHHERYDGGGYPDKKVGDETPIWAQIVSIVDVYDALVSKRVYKIAYAFDEAVRMINEGECGVFSPKLLDCFALAKYELFEATEGGVSYVEDCADSAYVTE